MRLSNLYSNLIYNDLIKSSKSEAVPSRPVSFLYNRLRASETAFAARQISIPISLFENPIFTSRQMRYSCSLMLWALYKASLNPTSIHPSSSSACNHSACDKGFDTATRPLAKANASEPTSRESRTFLITASLLLASIDACNLPLCWATYASSSSRMQSDSCNFCIKCLISAEASIILSPL